MPIQTSPHLRPTLNVSGSATLGDADSDVTTLASQVTASVGIRVSDVGAAAAPQLWLHNAADATTRVRFTNTADTNGEESLSHPWKILADPAAEGSPGDAAFKIFYGDADGDGSGQNILTIQGDKKVGINTSSPQNPFVLHGDNTVFRIGANNNEGSNFSSRIEFAEDCTGGDGDMTHGAFIEYDGDAAASRGNGGMNIGMRDGSTSDVDVILIDRDAPATAFYISDDGPRLSPSASIGRSGTATFDPGCPLEIRNDSDSGAECIRMRANQDDGSPYITWYSAGDRRAYIQALGDGHAAANDLRITSEYKGIDMMTATGGAEATTLYLSGSGEISSPRQPGFLAVQASNQSNIPNDQWVHVSASSEVYDQGSDYNTSDCKFVAPVDGKYFFSGTTRLNAIPSSATQYVWIRIHTSNRIYRSDLHEFDSQVVDYLQLTVTCIADMDAGDEASMWVHYEGGSGADIIGTATSDMQSYWQGWLLG